ncbi:hypothetical protein H7J06_28380 [Mycobacterium hodleri]|uniref:hypothetical protein n=1 Tax=Mycolicibacterium hodleri TaxID=49897 RepID=UPI0021F27A9A|nr:hypothetical protein [Mycolicibacterium hodleri]MCV7136891.1 hypothetical protein [Mycolicibacterium hodleri]
MFSPTDTSRASVRDFAHGKDSLLSVVRTAHNRLATATATGGTSEVQGAQHRLQIAVDAARDAGVAWGEIGDVLGLARGNAYQRYRHRAAR